jgi:hypothetical protein
MNFVSAWNLFEEFDSESIDSVDVERVNRELVKGCFLGVIDLEGVIVEDEVGEDWHEGLHHVVQTGSIQTQG